jgi:lipopolysaccharide/colanic/teichoic acid biosynthesis glycosyltransferase
MSLVGTRPPTVDEWDKHELHHRARLATKPELTGMWQVSGRSNITDFEEVVKLDKQYISELSHRREAVSWYSWFIVCASSETGSFFFLDLPEIIL